MLIEQRDSGYCFNQNGSLGNKFDGFMGPLLWLRIQETASNRNYYMGGDGLTWLRICQTTNTDFLTTTKYGIFSRDQGSQAAGMTLYSFSETNP